MGGARPWKAGENSTAAGFIKKTGANNSKFTGAYRRTEPQSEFSCGEQEMAQTWQSLSRE